VIAYLIMLHDRPEQALRLLRAIHSPEHAYIVHVDSRAAKEVSAAIDAGIGGLPNAQRLPSGRGTYNGWGLVDIHLRAIRGALETLGWEFFVNLSAQDYPLRSQDEIAAALRPHVGHSLLDFVDQRADWPGSLPRIERFYVDVRGRLAAVPGVPRRYPRGVRPFAGGAWMSLSREACSYLVSDDPQAARLKRFYRHTVLPDEGFIQTALANSPLRSKLVRRSRRHVEFDGNRPRTLTARDVERLAPTDVLFARKFDAATEPDALDAADALIAGG
jgi:core-2/I-Branching enzyme